MRVPIKAHELKLMTDYIYGLTGIHLDEGKGYLVEYRLSQMMADHNVKNYEQLYHRLREGGGAMQESLISAITTDETSFFRDTHPYQLLTTKLLPDLLAHKRHIGQNTLKLWSAASSRGQEAYSMAMTLREQVDLKRFEANILATDISEKVLAYASRGVYTKFELSRGLTLDRLNRHFIKEEHVYRIRDELRSLVHFRKINLHDALSGMGTFDIIFCRNVAVYFKEPDRVALFNKLARHLNPWGQLVIGSTESLVGLTDCFKARLFNGWYYYELKDSK